MNKTMLGAVLHAAKDLRVELWPVPQLHHGEVLVQVRRSGIYGSALHDFVHGHCAAFAPTRPFVLNHELPGEVAARAEAVRLPEVGVRVVVNPAPLRGSCSYWRRGRQNLCARTVRAGSEESFSTVWSAVINA